jgi:hypothetical protein
MINTELCNLFEKYGSDKCPKILHSYSSVYYDLLFESKHLFNNVLEIGVGNVPLMEPIVGKNYQVGASLKAWRDFFPNSQIIGLDIDNDVLFEEDRVKCFYTDQSNVDELEKTIKNIKDYKNNDNLLFDMILDDGSHITEHMVLSFNTFKKYLKLNGLYIIEDIQIKDLHLFENLESDDMVIVKIHKGFSEWDSFVAYKKVK